MHGASQFTLGVHLRAGGMSPAEDDTASTLAEGRKRIDAIDAQIIALVRERVTTSAELQRIRMAAGEPRIALR